MSTRFILQTPQGNLIADAAYKWAAVSTDPTICSGWFSEKQAQQLLKSMLKDNQVKDVSRALLESAVVAQQVG